MKLIPLWPRTSLPKVHRTALQDYIGLKLKKL